MMNCTSLIPVSFPDRRQSLSRFELYEENRRIIRGVIAFCDGWYHAGRRAERRGYHPWLSIPKSPDYAALRSCGEEQTHYPDDPEVALMIAQIALRYCEPARGMRNPFLLGRTYETNTYR